MNNLDHISESFKQFFAVRYLNSVMQNRDGKIRIRDGKNSDPGSGINIPDPQHWGGDVGRGVYRSLVEYGMCDGGGVY